MVCDFTFVKGSQNARVTPLNDRNPLKPILQIVNWRTTFSRWDAHEHIGRKQH